MENTPSQNILLYTTPNGKVKVEVNIQNETIWLTQKAIAVLFGVKVPAISKHLKNIFEANELQENSVISILETTAEDGKTYATMYYNLDAIIAVGYRVNSLQATHFRIWATQVLKELIIKGFVVDSERLRQAKTIFGKDYFDELLEKIRDIRSSERRFYQKITDLYALAADYDTLSDTTQRFFSTVQNKLHWAITGKTAAELIYSEADATKIYMGLQTWKNAPNGKILKSDVAIAKNYLNEEHIKELNTLVSAYLDLAENNARRQILMRMEDWEKFLDNFLQLSNYPILLHKGKISAEMAKIKAEGEYEKFRPIQDQQFLSDFDKLIEQSKQQ